MASQSTGLPLTPFSAPPVASEEGNSEGTGTDKATRDRPRRTPGGLYLRSNKRQRHKVKVTPTAAIDGEDRPLFAAALVGNWKYVHKKFPQNSEATMAKVMTVEQEHVTLLDVAVIAAQDELFGNLVNLLRSKSENQILKRALCNAARGGRIKMVKALIDKIDFEPQSIADALSTAISWAPMQKEVLWYLAKQKFTPDDDTISRLTVAGHMDIVYFLERKDDKLTATEETKLDRMLGYLVTMMSHFRSRARLGFWGKIIYKCIPPCLVNISFDKPEKMTQDSFMESIIQSKLRDKWLYAFGNLTLFKTMVGMDIPKILGELLTSHIIIDAASRGISEFVKLCLVYFPELMWEKNFTKELLEEVVRGRNVELFRLVNAHNTTPYMTDDELTRRGLMEAVLEWSPRCVSTDVSGAAFLIQRELQWFKVVEDMSDTFLKSLKFKVPKESLKLEDTDDWRGKTYWEVFVEQRQDLLKEAGQWMKDTSSSCSLVATLIITVAFAAAFTVPGGNDGNTGVPILLKERSFIVFAISDAFALFSSVTATLMFLAIITSPYAIDDFRQSLPTKMILGLTFLFLSLVFMLVAFGSALTIVLCERLKLIYIPITLLATFPIILFAILQLPLYIEMVISTWRPPLYRPIKIWK